MSTPIEGKPVCQSCKDAPAEAPHTCPYKQEIDNDESLCTCCAVCTQDCAEHI